MKSLSLDDLEAMPRWLVWKKIAKPGQLKATKVPFNRNGAADATNFANGMTFNDAMDMAVTMQEAGGIGFMLGEGICGVDLDGSYDPETKQTTPAVTEIINQFNSYTEITPNNGIHILVVADDPGTVKNSTEGVEIYGSERFFTMTFNHLEGTPVELHDRSAQLKALHARYKKPDLPSLPLQHTNTTYTDAEIINLIGLSKKGDRFNTLFNTIGTDGNSEVDLEMAGLIRFWTQDPVQIESIMRGSRMVRDKWNRDGGKYLRRTIQRAIAGGGEVYSPSQSVTAAELIERARLAMLKNKEEGLAEVPIAMFKGKPVYDDYFVLADAKDDPRLLTVSEPLCWTGWRNKVSLFYAREKKGKSTFIASDIALASHAGLRVLYFHEELTADVYDRLIEANANMNNIICKHTPPDSWEAAEYGIERTKPDIVYIDTITKFLTHIRQKQPKSSDEGDWDRLMNNFTVWAREYACSIIVVDHAKKDGTDYRGGTEKGGSVDLIVPFAVDGDIATLVYTGRVQARDRKFQWLGGKRGYKEITGSALTVLQLSPTARRLLSAIDGLIAKKQPTTNGAIATETDIDKGNVSRTLTELMLTNHLVKDGLGNYTRP